MADDTLPPEEPEVEVPRVIPFRREPNGAERDVLVPLVSRSATSFSDELKPRLFHVEGLIPAREVTLLYGDGAAGKSLLALQLARSTALARPWIGIEVAGGIALVVSAEDAYDEIERRLVDINRHDDTVMADLDRLEIISLVEREAVLARANKQGVLELTPLFGQIEAKIRELRPCLVVLDTLADLFSGNENDRGQARQFVGALRRVASRYDTTIVLLAHPSLAGLNSGTGLSGSTAWNNSVRSRLYLERLKSDEDGSQPNPDARVLKTMKANYAAQDREIRVLWRAGAFVPETISSLGAFVQRDRAQVLFLEILADYVAKGRTVSPDPSPVYAPTLFAKDPRAQTEGFTKTAFVNAMNVLFRADRIKVILVGPKSHQRQRLVLA